MNKKLTSRIAIVSAATALCALAARADWEFNIPTSFPYDLKPSAIVPSWSGTNQGEWSFNYEGVLAKAKEEGKYALLLFTGMWWCPHCQALEENALSKDGFAQYVADQGYYLAAVDFPYRDGHSNWCWLWDSAYRTANGIGDWTPEQVADEIARRFEFQELMHTQGAATTTNNNVLVQISDDGSTTNLAVYAANPTTVYRRVGYPTIIVIDPDGNEAGRFGYNFRTVDPATGLDYVINNIEKIKENAKLTAGTVDSSVAQVYDAVLSGAGGVTVGTATFKTAKKSKNADTVKVSATLQMAGGKKVTLKGEIPADGGETTLEKKGSAFTATVKFGAEGLTGTFKEGETSYDVKGGRNPFKGRDAASKARAAAVAKGFWTVVLDTADNGGSAFANGRTSLSVTLAAKGKAKTAVALGDGNKATLSSQAVLGNDGAFVVPVIAKKGEYSLTLSFAGGKLTGVSGISAWKGTGRPARFTAAWTDKPTFRADPGAGAVPGTMYLQIDGFDAAAGIGGKAVAVSPAEDAVSVKGNKWTGTKGVSDLSLTFKPKDGTFKGSFNIYVTDNGRQKKVKATVTGAVVDGTPSGTAVIKGVGSFAIKLAGTCGGGC